MTQYPIDKIKVGKRFRTDMGNLKSLAKSIHELGMLHPVVIDSEGNLIAGRRRIEVAKMIGWDSVPVHTVNIQLLRKGEFDENMRRKNLTPSERKALADVIREAERPKAKKRQDEGRKSGGRGRKKTSAKNLAKVSDEAGKTDEKAAEAVGMSDETLRKIDAVVAAAEEDPETFGPIKDEMDRTGKVDPAYQKVKEAKGKAKPKQAGLEKLKRDWDSATPTEKAAFIAWLREKGEIG